MKSNDARYSTSLLCKLTCLFVVTLTLVGVIVVGQWEHSFLVFKPASVGIFKYIEAQSVPPHDNITHDINTIDPVLTKSSSIVTTADDVQLELKQKLRNATENKVILVWIPMSISKSVPAVNSSNCGKCEVTYDRGRLNDSKTGAVVFHFHAIKPANMPSTRNLNQIYIFWDKESTANLRISRKISLEFEDKFMFNATMTYRRDSDFYLNYEYPVLGDILRKNTIRLKDLLRMKTKTAVAVVSNCRNRNGARTRFILLKELMKLVVDMEGYGECFNNRSVFANGHNHGTNHFTREVRKYKFFFAFENSYHCKDYISEKFFRNSLNSFTVPVVWGANKIDYEAVAPPGSFIFAEDFASMKQLAEYLNYLLKNDTAYMEYFRWLTMKPSEMPQHARARGWCQICRALHGINIDDIYNPKYNSSYSKRHLFTNGVVKRTVSRLRDWFYGEENPECFNT